MRKIFSIVITLGLVLGLSLIAAPAAAWDCVAAVPTVEVVVDPPCACDEAAYNLTFNISASLDQGVGCVCVEFPAGTTIPDEFDDGAILIGESSDPTPCEVFGSEVTVTGTKVCFIPPCHIDDHSEVLVQFTMDAGIENPCDPDDYSLFVYTCRAPDSTPIEGEYEITPALSQYGYLFDFSPTYDGVALGFVPPFKACGQNDTTEAAVEAGFDTTYIDGPDFTGWVTNFTLYFAALVEGCDVPCATADLWLEIVSIPEGEEMHLILDGTTYVFDVCNITKTVGEFDTSTDINFHDETLDVDEFLPFDGALHFSSPGTYTIGLYAECPRSTCFPGGIIASKVQDFVAHQDKDAAKIEVWEKWNLISLPLEPFDTSIESLMAAWDLDLAAPAGVSELISIHYFDQCTDTWSVYGNGQTSLSTMEAGKSYWVRMDYPLTVDPYTLWVWGTARPMPPEAPAIYTMCPGWNMFGFTSLLPTLMDNYLWNFGGAGEPDYPLVYTWWNPTGDWFDAGWYMMVPGVDWMLVGEGYWGYFPNGGTIVP